MSVEQLDHDEVMRPMHGMYETLDAELEAQRTVNRSVLAAFECLLTGVIGPTKVYVDNKGIVDGTWRGEMRCIGPRAKDADLWIMIWENRTEFIKKACYWKLSTSKLIASNRKCGKCCFFEKFITEGNEKADELAKEGARLDGGDMAHVRAITIQQEREEVFQLCNMQRASIVWWKNGKIVRSLRQSQKKSGSL